MPRAGGDINPHPFILPTIQMHQSKLPKPTNTFPTPLGSSMAYLPLIVHSNPAPADTESQNAAMDRYAEPQDGRMLPLHRVGCGRASELNASTASE